MEGGGDTIYITPAPPRPGTNLYVIATGDSESELAALGPNNPPIPTRCCAICSNGYYKNTSHTLSYDVFQTNISTLCASFSLHYWNDGASLVGWYCLFHDSNTSTPQDPVDPDEPVFHYLR